MTKNIITAVIAAASALLLSVSCAKELPGEGDINGNAGRVFTATIAQGLTKTTLGEGLKVNWETGDQININGAVYTATPSSIGSSASFGKISGNEPSPAYRAIYPATLFKSPGVYEFPEIQEYSDTHFNAPMYAESMTESLFFKNICGVLCLSLTGTDIVKRISVTANEPVCGTFTMNGETINLTGTGNMVTLDCGADGVQLSQTPTQFYIYLPPQTYTAGMKIVVTNTEEYVFKKVTIRDAEILASNLYSFSWDINAFSPALTGEFSIGEGRKISFAQGNFHATKRGNSWRYGFYEGQNEFNTIATVSGARTASSGDREIDLFTWGYGNTFTADPTTLSYGQIFSDWGTQIGSGSTWRTLTGDEWNYMLATRENASELYKKDVTVCGVEGCLVIAPDDFTGNIVNNYDKAMWSTAEKTDGLVCLPPAGHRYGVGVGNTGRLGFYWASDQTDATNAKSLSLSKEGQSESELVLYADAQEKKFSGWGDDYSEEKVTEGGIDCYKINHTTVMNFWEVQFAYLDLGIDNYSEYHLTIKAKVSAGTYGMLPMFQETDTYTSCNASELNLTTEWQVFERTIMTDKDGLNRLTFSIGDYNGDVFVAYVQLEKVVSHGLKTEVHAAQGFPNGVGHAFGAEGFTCGETTVDDIHCFGMTNTAVGETYSAKYQIEFPEKTFEAGKKCRIKIKAKATETKSITCYLVKALGTEYPNCGDFPAIELTTEWKEYVIETNCTDSDATAIAFDFGDFEGSIYLAEFSVYKLVEIPYAATTTDGVGTAANNRGYGLAVRLVRDITQSGDISPLADSNDYDDLFN